MINVHASLLPRYRGAAPVHRAVMAGETETGVTIMRVVKALDAGSDAGTRVRTPIAARRHERGRRARLAELGAELLVDVVDRMAQGPIEEVPQDDSQATYAHKLTRDDGPMDWTRGARRCTNSVRGLHPWPHASTLLHGGRVDRAPYDGRATSWWTRLRQARSWRPRERR